MRDTIGRIRTSGSPAESAGEDALETLFAENVDALFGYVFARCGSRSLAEDISGETFAEAARANRQGAANLDRGWLLHVARLRLIDHWRREERHRRRVERLKMLTPHGGATLEAAERDPDVLAALDSLSSRQRASLILRYIDDCSVSEVAEALDVSYQATESLLARSRRALLAAYEEMTEVHR